MQEDEESVIYFIHAPSAGLIKIGYTAGHPDDRLKRLMATNAAPLVPMRLMEGGRPDELALHRRFLPLWSHGEWFRESPELLAFVESAGEPWDFAPLKHVHAPATVRRASVPDDVWAAENSATIKGETRTVAEWSELSGYSVHRLRALIREDADLNRFGVGHMIFRHSRLGLKQRAKRGKKVAPAPHVPSHSFDLRKLRERQPP